LTILKKEFPKEPSMMKYRREQFEREGKPFILRYYPVPLSKISPYLVKAVLIAEDDKFYRHEGFDWDALQKALEKNLKEGKIKYGGSTISQQLAKNLYLSPSKNPIRKIKEAILTVRLEKALSKRRILELYLSIAEWGPGVFGAEAASRYYFGKSALGLSPFEAVRLAAVLPNPLKYNPLSHEPFVEKRSRLLLPLLKKRGILKEELKELKQDLPKDEFKEEGKDQTQDKATGIAPEKESEEAPSKNGSPGEGEDRPKDNPLPKSLPQ
jgi:monofunctional biosynthetic peptidoglycan transglycosylase